MKVELLTIIMEHFLMTRGVAASDMRDSIPYAEGLSTAANRDGVEAILEAALIDFNLPVEDLDDVSADIFNYASIL